MEATEPVEKNSYIPYIQFSVYDPRVRRAITKNVGAVKRSPEEVQKIGAEWKAQMREDIEHWKKQQATIDMETNKEKEYDMKKVVPFAVELPNNGGCSFLLLGSGRSGKSTFMKYLYKTHFKKHITACFSMSLHAEIYKDLGKDVAVCPEYRPDIIKDMYEINKGTKNKYDFLAIVDDCPLTKNDKELMKTLTIYRNTGVSAIIANQELSMFNATARSNITFACLFKMNSDMAIEKVVKAYLRSYFPSNMNMNEMIKQYRTLTDNHHFFFINNLTGRVCLTKINP
jgi:hypothetical protein